MKSITLSMGSVTLYEKWELVSMDIVDLCMKSAIGYPWIMFTYTKWSHNFPRKVHNTVHRKSFKISWIDLIRWIQLDSDQKS